jgi:hypothetical protein
VQFRPDKDFLLAVLNLQINEDFQKIVQSIQAYHLQCGLEFPRYRLDDLIKLQGRSALALEFITSVDPKLAREELDKIIMTEASQRANAMLNKKIPF